MTHNQINYWNYKETQRSNMARENEQQRSNLANEAETRRSNVAKERETNRHNVQDEKIRHTANSINTDKLRLDNAKLTFDKKKEATRKQEWADTYLLSENKDSRDTAAHNVDTTSKTIDNVLKVGTALGIGALGAKGAKAYTAKLAPKAVTKTSGIGPIVLEPVLDLFNVSRLGSDNSGQVIRQ